MRVWLAWLACVAAEPKLHAAPEPGAEVVNLDSPPSQFDAYLKEQYKHVLKWKSQRSDDWAKPFKGAVVKENTESFVKALKAIGDRTQELAKRWGPASPEAKASLLETHRAGHKRRSLAGEQAAAYTAKMSHVSDEMKDLTKKLHDSIQKVADESPQLESLKDAAAQLQEEKADQEANAPRSTVSSDVSVPLLEREIDADKELMDSSLLQRDTPEEERRKFNAKRQEAYDNEVAADTAAIRAETVAPPPTNDTEVLKARAAKAAEDVAWHKALPFMLQDYKNDGPAIQQASEDAMSEMMRKLGVVDKDKPGFDDVPVSLAQTDLSLAAAQRQLDSDFRHASAPEGQGGGEDEPVDPDAQKELDSIVTEAHKEDADRPSTQRHKDYSADHLQMDGGEGDANWQKWTAGDEARRAQISADLKTQSEELDADADARQPQALVEIRKHLPVVDEKYEASQRSLDALQVKLRALLKDKPSSFAQLEDPASDGAAAVAAIMASADAKVQGEALSEEGAQVESMSMLLGGFNPQCTFTKCQEKVFDCHVTSPACSKRVDCLLDAMKHNDVGSSADCYEGVSWQDMKLPEVQMYNCMVKEGCVMDAKKSSMMSLIQTISHAHARAVHRARRGEGFAKAKAKAHFEEEPDTTPEELAALQAEVKNENDEARASSKKGDGPDDFPVTKDRDAVENVEDHLQTLLDLIQDDPQNPEVQSYLIGGGGTLKDLREHLHQVLGEVEKSSGVSPDSSSLLQSFGWDDMESMYDANPAPLDTSSFDSTLDALDTKLQGDAGFDDSTKLHRWIGGGIGDPASDSSSNEFAMPALSHTAAFPDPGMTDFSDSTDMDPALAPDTGANDNPYATLDAPVTADSPMNDWGDDDHPSISSWSLPSDEGQVQNDITSQLNAVEVGPDPLIPTVDNNPMLIDQLKADNDVEPDTTYNDPMLEPMSYLEESSRGKATPKSAPQMRTGAAQA